MANSTRAQLVEQIDWERRETNSKFISPTQTVKLIQRGTNRILREPGIRTIEETQIITAQANTVRYALNDDFKEVINLQSGSGGNNPVTFSHRSPDDFDLVILGYVYTFKAPGFIDIKFPDVGTLPSTIITLNYWTKNIVLDVDGTTKKRTWDNDGDKSRLPEEFDDFYIMWPVSKILRRDGKKEANDYLADAKDTLEMLKEAPASKTRRPRRQFGHYMTE